MSDDAAVLQEQRHRRSRAASNDETVVTVSTVSSIPSVPSIPSIQITIETESETVPVVARTTTTNNNNNNNGNSSAINKEVIPGEIEFNGSEQEYNTTTEEEHQQQQGDEEENEEENLHHERQVLLLFLLAQVCALHDPTPRTFTVHVLGLFEQGLLDHEAIHFLFELGFVPSPIIDARGLLASANANNTNCNCNRTAAATATATTATTPTTPPTNNRNNNKKNYNRGEEEGRRIRNNTVVKKEKLPPPIVPKVNTPNDSDNNENNEALVAVVNKAPTIPHNASLRSLAANNIRKELSSQHDNDIIHHHRKRGSNGNTEREKNSTNNNSNMNINMNTHNHKKKSWHVDNYPLSMSRYEREFQQLRLINAGAFGQVFHAVRRELDGYEYAVKKITFNATGYTNDSIERVIREVQCLAAVNDHPNTVRYYTSWLEPTWMLSGTTNTTGATTKSDKATRKELRKQLLQIEQAAVATTNNADNNSSFDTYTSLQPATASEEESPSWSSASSSSSSRCYDYDNNDNSDDDNNISDGNNLSTSWESYHSHSLEKWTDVYDDSYNHTNTKESLSSASVVAGKRRRKQRSSSPKNSVSAKTKTTKYQYQISLYIQMELCHPMTLQDWILERNKVVPDSNHQERIGPAMNIFQQICNGLAHIHKTKVIHRDLKPANVFVSADGKTVKIGDFGLSKQLNDIATNTNTNSNSNNSSRSSPSATTTATAAENEVGGKTKESPSPQKNSYRDINDATTITENNITNDNAIVSAVRQPYGMTTSSTQMLVKYTNRTLVLSDDDAADGSVKNPPLLTAGVGTATYAAPEQVRSKIYDTSVDIFSLGLILLELVSCFETDHERLHNLQQCRYKRVPEWITSKYPDIARTILLCTKQKAHERPTAKDLISMFSSSSSPGAMTMTTTFNDQRHKKELNLLQERLLEKEAMLAQKDTTIEKMKLEIEKMKKALLVAASSSGDDRN